MHDILIKFTVDLSIFPFYIFSAILLSFIIVYFLIIVCCYFHFFYFHFQFGNCPFRDVLFATVTRNGKGEGFTSIKRFLCVSCWFCFIYTKSSWKLAYFMILSELLTCKIIHRPTKTQQRNWSQKCWSYHLSTDHLFKIC